MTHKEKILVFAVNSGFNKTQFCKKCGLSNGYLDSKGSITTDKLALILENFRNLSINWLLFDEGEMLKKENGGIKSGQNKTLSDFPSEEIAHYVIDNPEKFKKGNVLDQFLTVSEEISEIIRFLHEKNDLLMESRIFRQYIGSNIDLLEIEKEEKDLEEKKKKIKEAIIEKFASKKNS